MTLSPSILSLIDRYTEKAVHEVTSESTRNNLYRQFKEKLSGLAGSTAEFEQACRIFAERIDL